MGLLFGPLDKVSGKRRLHNELACFVQPSVATEHGETSSLLSKRTLAAYPALPKAQDPDKWPFDTRSTQTDKVLACATDHGVAARDVTDRDGKSLARDKALHKRDACPEQAKAR